MQRISRIGIAAFLATLLMAPGWAFDDSGGGDSLTTILENHDATQNDVSGSVGNVDPLAVPGNPGPTTSNVGVSGQGTQSVTSGSEPGYPCKGVVDVRRRLNVRTGPWGKIIGGFGPGTKVEIVAREGNWYRIRRGDGFAYIHRNYVDAPGVPAPRGVKNYPVGVAHASPTGSSSPGHSGVPAPSGPSSVSPAAAPPTEPGTTNPVAARVAQIARDFLTRYNGYMKFPYASGTQQGRLGCANVVSAVLKEAGVKAYSLGCTSLKNALLKLPAPDDWKMVNPPPYQEGDVVVWGPTPRINSKHVGIVIKNGNTYAAMNNNSTKRQPGLREPIDSRPVVWVLRKS